MEELILLGDGGVLGNIEEDLSELSADSFTEVGDGELGSIDLFLELGARNLGRGGADLLKDPVDDVILSAAASVLNLLALPI
jgi:hypothetical protein